MSGMAGQFVRGRDDGFLGRQRKNRCQMIFCSHGAIEWGSEIDICPDAMYLRLTGKSPEELFPSLRSIHADA